MFAACGTKHQRCCLLVTSAASSVLCTASCKHSLVLLRMGEIIAPKHVELIKIINKIIIVASSWLFILLLCSKFRQWLVIPFFFFFVVQLNATRQIACVLSENVAYSFCIFSINFSPILSFYDTYSQLLSC